MKKNEISDEAALKTITMMQVFCGRCDSKLLIYSALTKAVKALEKQIPETPYFEYGEYHCKACGMVVFDDESYCWQCGQAIDWRAEE